MQKTYKTSRLLLRPLNLKDTEFILELMNTQGWISFIGDRNIKSIDNAQEYIRKTLGDQNIQYWIVQSEREIRGIGTISFIKRDYLEHYDLGFAFLPAFHNQGYAFEAALKVLEDKLKEDNHKSILATVKPENQPSIKLLEKLGFRFIKKMEHEHKQLFLYGINSKSADSL